MQEEARGEGYGGSARSLCGGLDSPFTRSPQEDPSLTNKAATPLLGTALPGLIQAPSSPRESLGGVGSRRASTEINVWRGLPGKSDTPTPIASSCLCASFSLRFTPYRVLGAQVNDQPCPDPGVILPPPAWNYLFSSIDLGSTRKKKMYSLYSIPKGLICLCWKPSLIGFCPIVYSEH